MRQWRNGLVACLLAVAALGAGCGSDDSSGPTNNPAVNEKVSNAVDQCLKQAKSISDKDARKTATEACKAAKSGDAGGVKSAAKKQCLNAVEQIPDSAMDQKDAAKKRCEAIK
jgi:hypothetical protein